MPEPDLRPRRTLIGAAHRGRSARLEVEGDVTRIVTQQGRAVVSIRHLGAVPLRQALATYHAVEERFVWRALELAPAQERCTEPVCHCDAMVLDDAARGWCAEHALAQMPAKGIS